MRGLISKFMTGGQRPPPDEIASPEEAPATLPVAVSSQAELVRIDLPEGWISGDTCIAAISLRTTCPLVGLYAISGEGMETGELLYVSHGDVFNAEVFLPPRSRSIVIRNASNHSVVNDIDIASISYEPFGRRAGSGACQQELLATAGRTNVLIHTAGKTGSVSLEEALHQDEKIIVSRDHFINLPSLSHSTHWTAKELLMQLTSWTLRRKRSAYSLLSNFSGSSFVVCGIRSPISQAISSMFQNQGILFLAWRFSIDEIIKAVTANLHPNLELHDLWWRREFFPLHDVDENKLEESITCNGCIYEQTNITSKHTVLYYRTEDGDDAMRKVLARIIGEFDGEIPRSNTSDAKPYKDIYDAVKAPENYTVDWTRYPTLARINRIFGYTT